MKSNNPDGKHRLLCIMVFTMLFSMVAGSNICQASTEPRYEVNVEVDWYPGTLNDNLVAAFNFMVDYFKERNIEATVEFNSPNNQITGGNGYITSEDRWHDVERSCHDFPETHILFLVAKHIPGGYGASLPFYGAGISTDVVPNNTFDYRYLIMHEIGHCIGIGWQDEGASEIYSSDGFMASYVPESRDYSLVNSYLDEDWADAFQPINDNEPVLKNTARIWNRYSVEICSEISMVYGLVESSENSWAGEYIIIHSLSLDDKYYTQIVNRTFMLSLPPGEYSIGFSDESYASNVTTFNVTVRQDIELFLTVSRNNAVYSSPSVAVFIMTFSTVIILLSMIIIRKRSANLK